MEYIAHVRDQQPRVQSVEEHLHGTAALAKLFAASFPWAQYAYQAGLWHDVGKYSELFQRRIRIQTGYGLRPEDEERAAPRADHSTAGAQHACEKLPEVGKLLAYAIAGHHAGLPEGNASEDSCLNRRLTKAIPDFSACPPKILNCTLTPQLKDFPLNERLVGFSFALFVRMLFSCVVDADRLDTEAFMNPEQAAQRQGCPTLPELREKLAEFLRQKTAEAARTPVNLKRNEILEQCLQAAHRPPGLFSLTVPTGGGKTLSSLAFAFDHAIEHNLGRVIYVIPYTSIIEQNAAVFREVLGDRAVLEHHSNFDPQKDDTSYDEPVWDELAAENWDAPVIVTTSVQFFESLFSAKTSRNRKLHNIANSVVILDEAQMLPVELLRPCLEILRHLTELYRTSVVLCTATQPALKQEDEFPEGLENVHEIIADPHELYQSLKRTHTSSLGTCTDEQLARHIKQHRQALCIVNLRAHARELFEMLDGEGCYHLSALMCPAHRSATLAKVRYALKHDQPCRVISTQVIEAGVDVDFSVVYREIAGLDSIAQAAGRCNREGRRETGLVFVFQPEKDLPKGHFRHTAQTALSVLGRYEADPLALDAVREYFQHYYWLKGDELDKEQIINDLQECGNKLNIPFRTVDKKFKLIKNDTIGVIIPWGEAGHQLVEDIRTQGPSTGLSRKAQAYTVQLYRNVFGKLCGQGIELVHDMYPVLINEDLYREDVGLCPDDPTFHQAESLCI